MSISAAQSRDLETKVQTPQQGFEATATTGSSKALKISDAFRNCQHSGHEIKLLTELRIFENCEHRANSDCGALRNYDLLASPQSWALHARGHGLERPLPNSQVLLWPPISRHLETSWPLEGISKCRKSHHFEKIPGQGRRLPCVHPGKLPPCSGQYFACINK
eukprot:s965_g1.t1